MQRLLVCIADRAKEQVFNAGSVVNGNVILSLENAEKIDRIDLSFSGKSYIFVSEFEQELMKEKCSHADSDQEQIIDFNTTLWDGCIHSLLEAGTHTFPFGIELPDSLPTSFQMHSKDLHGCHIAYTLKASVVRPKKKSYRAEVPIMITNELNISGPSFTSMQSVSGKKGKSGILRYLPTNGCVAMEVTTDRSGYCVGDSIAISADIMNNTKSKISSLQASLIRNIIHKDHYHDNYCSVIKKVKNHDNHTNMFLHIPQTSPSITNYDMLKVTYKLKVKLKMANGIKVVAFLPITIGTVSFDEYVLERDQYAEVTRSHLLRLPSLETLSSDSSTDLSNS